ncbi:hypothetical protein FRC07_001153, partial [Ceratobasidium sp. 392]
MSNVGQTVRKSMCPGMALSIIEQQVPPDLLGRIQPEIRHDAARQARTPSKQGRYTREIDKRQMPRAAQRAKIAQNRFKSAPVLEFVTELFMLDIGLGKMFAPAIAMDPPAAARRS